MDARDPIGPSGSDDVYAYAGGAPGNVTDKSGLDPNSEGVAGSGSYSGQSVQVMPTGLMALGLGLRGAWLGFGAWVATSAAAIPGLLGTEGAAGGCGAGGCTVRHKLADEAPEIEIASSAVDAISCRKAADCITLSKMTTEHIGTGDLATIFPKSGKLLEALPHLPNLPWYLHTSVLLSDGSVYDPLLGQICESLEAFQTAIVGDFSNVYQQVSPWP